MDARAVFSMRMIRFCIPFLFLATVPVGILLGGAAAFWTVVAVPVVLCGFDWALGYGHDAHATPEGICYRMLPWLYVLGQIAVTAWTATVIANPKTTLLEAVGATVSVGVSAGVFGMLAAHELVHRRVRGERALGLAMLATVGYMHFRIAHIHGHHVRAATFEDPTTARRGENVYHFVVRAVIGQIREAWGFEATRLRRRGEPLFGPSNRMLQYAGIEVLLAVGFWTLNARAFGFWLAQATLAIVMLELFNYIAHYGLVRRQAPGQAPERISARHSWNSSRRMNNWSLFNMGRHSDHHRRPSRAYQGLEAMGETPELPTGYAGAILLALLPPLWRKIMDPQVDFWAGENPRRAEVARET
jgi:alkane 1-monooxygenase